MRTPRLPSKLPNGSDIFEKVSISYGSTPQCTRAESCTGDFYEADYGCIGGAAVRLFIDGAHSEYKMTDKWIQVSAFLEVLRGHAALDKI